MDNTSNWEFAAAVAGVSIGLGGMLLFTLVAVIGSWRIYRLGGEAAAEARLATLAVQDLARQLVQLQFAASAPAAAPRPPAPEPDLAEEAGELAALRREAAALIEQQSRLQDAVRNLVEAGVLRADAAADAGGASPALEASVRRLEENLDRIAAAVAKLGAQR